MTEDWHTSSYSAHNGNCVQARWRKASASASNGHCVEVAFRKSSHSHADGNCVEVADDCGKVLVRDSKDSLGPVLAFTRREWEAFTAGVRAGA